MPDVLHARIEKIADAETASVSTVARRLITIGLEFEERRNKRERASAARADVVAESVS